MRDCIHKHTANNVLEGESLAALIHEGGAWGESRAVVSERREVCTSLSPGR
jgi:hypothetical protein